MKNDWLSKFSAQVFPPRNIENNDSKQAEFDTFKEENSAETKLRNSIFATKYMFHHKPRLFYSIFLNFIFFT